MGLKGMCENSTRKLTWEDNSKLNMEPIFLTDSRLTELEEGVSVVLTVVHITTTEDYQIFDAIKSGNTSQVLDLIDLHLGVNAVDEWGQTVLMIAVANQNLEILSSLLNTRMPKVNVNLAKSVNTLFLMLCASYTEVPVSMLCLSVSFDDHSLVSLLSSTQWRRPLTVY